jgi:hypothetical protein
VKVYIAKVRWRTFSKRYLKSFILLPYSLKMRKDVYLLKNNHGKLLKITFKDRTKRGNIAVNLNQKDNIH